MPCQKLLTIEEARVFDRLAGLIVDLMRERGVDSMCLPWDDLLRKARFHIDFGRGYLAQWASGEEARQRARLQQVPQQEGND